uniref:F-actin monooxygenase n=1 Tax=Plectus sambesii TaxID=2011161 RepID=A0A914WD64_9BILA
MDSVCPVTLFDHFVAASTFKSIVQTFNQICTVLRLDPLDSAHFYNDLKTLLTSWKAKKLWALLDKRAAQKEYKKQKACQHMRVLVIGAGPCGLRAAIESALLGAKVVVVEKRDRFSRNNVLHIWPFVIQDLKNLGAKLFYPKFCAGAIDHISIRQLQCILLKVSLVLGVEIHDGVSFNTLLPPRPLDDENNLRTGWRANFTPADHFLSEMEFDVVIGADGKRNTLPGFPRRELRGKLAIGITANFVNRRSQAEEKVSEISGVAFIFNQQFFKDMKAQTGVDLENIVYYKDETHYFVMCAKKQSLLDKGVLLRDYDDISSLLSAKNIDQAAMLGYAREAADFATEGALPHLDYALNHFGQPDVAMFDFTSLFSAQCSVRLVERFGRPLLMAIVGDSLHEPFWPTGSGCARGFLSAFDAAWMMRSFGLGKMGPMQILAERESAYRLLAQATPENLHKNVQKYTIDPRTRYISLEMTIRPEQVSHLVDTDQPRMVPTDEPLVLKTYAHRQDDPYLRRQRVIRFCQAAVVPFKLRIDNLTRSWADGRSLIALVSRFRSDLFDYVQLTAVTDDAVHGVRAVLKAVEVEYQLEQVCAPEEWPPERDVLAAYLEQLVERFIDDTDRMRRALMASSPGKNLLKRKAPRQIDASRPKKSEAIQKRSQALINSLSGNSREPEVDVDQLLAEEGEHLDEGDVNEILAEWEEEETVERHYRRLKSLDDYGLAGGSNQSKQWTKRPLVEKLNPERLFKAEQIVNGTIESTKRQELYRQKRRQALINTRKLEHKDLEEMEQKLELTGMGVLFDRDQFKTMSSKDEKIIRVKAAEARKAAVEGYTRPAEFEKYKEIDEKLTKADALLKYKSLAGVDTVSKMIRRQNAPEPPPRSKPPVPPPRKSDPGVTSDSSTPIKHPPSLSITKRPASMGEEPSFDTPFGQRQQRCQLCGGVVYLAERMQVESLFIHKKCFRCAYCGQPLRLGNCGYDRDLGPDRPGQFFCTQHLNLPLATKMAKIEKQHVRISTRSASEPVEFLTVATNQCSPTTPTLKPMPVRLAQLNSPSTILAKTMAKMRVQAEAATAVTLPTLAKSQAASTPERAEFEFFSPEVEKNGTQTGESADENEEVEEALVQRYNLGYSDEQLDGENELDQEPELDSGVSASDACGATSTASSETPADDSSSSDDDDDDDDLSEEEIEELEKTLGLENAISYEQAASLANTWKQRRTLGRSSDMTTTDDESRDRTTTNETQYFTPKGGGSTADVSSAEDDSIFKTPAVPPTGLATREENGSVRERKLKELAQFREEARRRARLKSDDELCLVRTPSDRRSTPSVGDYYTPNDTSRLRASSLMEEVLASASSSLQTTPVKVVEEKPVQRPPPTPPPVTTRPPSPSAGMGLMARLFTPERIRKPSPTSPSSTTEGLIKATDVVSCESQKETSILGKFAAKKYKKRKSRSPDKPIIGGDVVDARRSSEEDISPPDAPVTPSTPTPALPRANGTALRFDKFILIVKR